MAMAQARIGPALEVRIGMDCHWDVLPYRGFEAVAWMSVEILAWRGRNKLRQRAEDEEPVFQETLKTINIGYAHERSSSGC